MKKKINFLVIGLGYVGINLYYNLCKHYKNVYGLDTSKQKIRQLKNNFDSTNQVNNLKTIEKKIFSSIIDKKFDRIFICVPTPVKKTKPDLKNLIKAFKTAGGLLNHRGILINESTVYPGLTRELGLNFIQKKNYLLNKDFYLSFSPERISPGDNIPFNKIKKIVGSSNKYSQKNIAKIYNKILSSKILNASDLETAEAVKILENTQRDTNIALINEFNDIFRRRGLRTREIVNLAASKWNFYKVFPGLVGGQCIPVDPYYAIKYARDTGKKLKISELSRRINENQKIKIKNVIIKLFKLRKKILFIGASYKINTYDYKYSKIFEIMLELEKKKINFSYYDSKLKDIKLSSKNIKSIKLTDINKYNNIIIGNSINKKQLSLIIKQINKKKTVSLINLSSHTIKSKNKFLNIEMEPFV